MSDTLLEAGKKHSAETMKSLQTVHDTVAGLGATCAAGNSSALGIWNADRRDAFIREATAVVPGLTKEQSEALHAELNRKFSEAISEVASLTYEADHDMAFKAAGGIALTETVEPFNEVELNEALSDTATQKNLPVKLIAPGWGSSGYYSAEMLKRDGPKVFKAGTHMYMNHATAKEEADRPEGDVRNLAAVLAKDAYWDPAGRSGPGLYSEAKPFSDHAQVIKEKGPHIGTSIRAYGKGVQGEAEGRKGIIIEALTIGRSLDFVTKAGAGGQVFTESAKDTQESGQQPPIHKGDEHMTVEETQLLQEANAKANEAEKLGLLRWPLGYRSSISGVQGEAEGRKGIIIEALTIGRSLDFVTKAGAGGQVFTESAKDTQESGQQPPIHKGDEHMTVEETQLLQEANAKANEAEKAAQVNAAENARLKGQIIQRDAEKFLSETLYEFKRSGQQLHPMTTDRIMAECMLIFPLTEDKHGIDKTAFAKIIAEKVRAETEYLVKVNGRRVVEGMGSPTPPNLSEEDYQKEAEKVFSDPTFGLSEAGAKIAARG